MSVRSPFITERQKNARGFCGNPDAPFPEPLIEYIHVDFRGEIDFDYLALASSLHARLIGTHRSLETIAITKRAKDRAYEMGWLRRITTEEYDRHQLVSAQWTAHLDALEASRNLTARAAA
ncbi:hypothetical protein JQ594_15320 [Bradyrhizobium manausense]|uniref:hypothetical protein n=1 Tax=Bradyrhizobium manausense TaxID=989370 RepID=UPI001BAC83F1|nr:hypothetical protein [Bradyrhizobium manausense]MBR0687300.1 hypothetical protein [Bradyrhizobium manausense]